MVSSYDGFVGWRNRQAEANQQTNMQQMVYEQSQLIQQLIREFQGLREDLRYERIERRGI